MNENTKTDLSQEYLDWFNALEPWLKEIVAKYPPNKIYVLKETGQKCTIYSWSEDGTPESVTMNVLIISGFNQGIIVYGNKPENFRVYYGENN